MYDGDAILHVWQALFASMIDVWLGMFDAMLIARCKAVHGLGRISFGPNSNSTRQHWVESGGTRN